MTRTFSTKPLQSGQPLLGRLDDNGPLFIGNRSNVVSEDATDARCVLHQCVHSKRETCEPTVTPLRTTETSRQPNALQTARGACTHARMLERNPAQTSATHSGEWFPELVNALEAHHQRNAGRRSTVYVSRISVRAAAIVVWVTLTGTDLRYHPNVLERARVKQGALQARGVVEANVYLP